MVELRSRGIEGGWTRGSVPVRALMKVTFAVRRDKRRFIGDWLPAILFEHLESEFGDLR